MPLRRTGTVTTAGLSPGHPRAGGDPALLNQKRRTNNLPVFIDSAKISQCKKGLPPIHDIVRFWHNSETAIFQSCFNFLNRKPPIWNLHWLRECAPRIFSGELSENVVKQAVKANVPEDAQRSVLKAVSLIFKSLDAHKWTGIELAEKKIVVDGFSIAIKPVGIYFSEKLKRKFIVALQPRAEDAPSAEQFRIWHSCLHHYFSNQHPIDAMIIDLSKNAVSGNRELREFTSKKLILLEKVLIDDRLAKIARQFTRAADEAPARVKSTTKRRGQKDFGF